MDNLDALLADLQNTISPSRGGYGSLNGARPGNIKTTRTTTSDYAQVNPPKSPYRTTSPTYQNETKTGGSKMTTSLNNNLTELDSLLQDLSTSRFSAERKMPVEVKGGSNSVTVKDMKPSQNAIPSRTVDSLLNQLNTPPPTNGLGDHYVEKIMIEETTTTTTKTSRPTASSATRELDDLMASLSNFKVNQGGATVPDYAKPGQTKPELDCILGTLQADMNRQGVTTTQKGCCSACDKPIVGQVITALGKTWHPEHFVCAHCNQELGTRNFFERDGRPYCETDYHNLFSPRCAYCNGPILDKCVTALEKTWHMEHFFCAQCGKQFGEEGFHEKDGKPFCRDDYFDMFAPKCGGCGRPIMENYVSALNAQWHTDCFVCRDCKKAVMGKTFYCIEGKPTCPKCVGADEEDE